MIQHAQKKKTRQEKRTSVNPLFTIISQDERVSAYYAASEILPSDVEKTIIKVFSDYVVEEYVKELDIPIVMYECSKLSVHGTQYKQGQFVLLPESSNKKPVFGKIWKTLSCDKYGYIYYQKTTNAYDQKMDLYMITEMPDFGIVPCIHLPSYHTLEAYKVGEGKEISISMRNYILEHL